MSVDWRGLRVGGRLPTRPLELGRTLRIKFVPGKLSLKFDLHSGLSQLVRLDGTFFCYFCEAKKIR
jgi:hypothetical protein